jgi:hypothetical protein
MQIQSLSHWIVLAEGTRPQPIQTEIKTGSRRLYCLSERDWSTEMIQARKQPIEHCQMGWPGKFLFRSHMLMPFPGNYHVPDSIDWCSSCWSFMANPRSAKIRRTERTIYIYLRHSGSFAERRGKLSCSLFWLQMSAEKVFYCLQWSARPLPQNPPLVLCVKQRLLRIRNY